MTYDVAGAGYLGDSSHGISEPGTPLTVNRAIDLLERSGIEMAGGLAELYRWFIAQGHASEPIRRARNVVPITVGDDPLWMVEDGGTDLACMGNRDSTRQTIKLLSQRGIHKPNGADFAVTLICGNDGRYRDSAEIDMEDGTKVILYRAQEQSRSSGTSNRTTYNKALARCFELGLPVGVYQRASSSLYRAGLFFVTGAHIEEGKFASGVFTLQGPVESFADSRFCRLDGYIEPKSAEQEVVVDIALCGRDLVMARRARRSGQSLFRSELIRAYGGRCAVSGCSVEEALEAAHAWRYYGERSQTAAHGLLLRADIHRLYDARLCAVNPETYVMEFARSIKDSSYERDYGGKRIYLPMDRGAWPSSSDLGVHYGEFMLEDCG